MSAPPNTTAQSGATAPTAPAAGIDSIRQNDSAEAERSQQAARPVEPLASVTGPAFRDFPQSKPQDRQPQRKIDEKHPSPRTVLVNHPPSTGPIAAVIDGEAGPRPDSAAALLLGKISADQSQAAGDQQRPAYSLEPLATISCRMLGASPHQAEATEKSATPARRSCGGRTGPLKTRQ
jgi:hypothetical protein